MVLSLAWFFPLKKQSLDYYVMERIRLYMASIKLFTLGKRNNNNQQSNCMHGIRHFFKYLVKEVTQTIISTYRPACFHHTKHSKRIKTIRKKNIKCDEL